MGKTLKTACLLAIVLTALAGATACNTSGCLDNGSAIPLAGFYSSATGADVSLDSLRVHGIGAPADSAVIRPGNEASQIYLPMHAGNPSTAWCIAYSYKGLDNPAFNDTLTFDYEEIPYFASEECGAMYIYRLSSVRHTCHLIDSVTLTDSLITNLDIETIRIYFRTSAPEEPAR